jgi:hypothetical protein
MVSIQEFVGDLAKVHGPCYRKIDVQVDPETGKKMSCGERNNLSQDQIRASPGEGNTFSLYLNHCPGLMCIDFDTKQLGTCQLWSELVSLDCLRVETRKGWHCYLRTQAPFDSCKMDALKDISGDILVGTGNNVWETDNRVLTGTLQDVDWSVIEPHVQLSKAKRKERKEPTTARDHKPLPQCLEGFLTVRRADTGS